ncbi:unnamed protein product [Polarella glacialis]|uniref:Uncharacterized protein n=1 Tax=Polarella glacialis TaxID=89957 RepID=A0A813EEZ4_POLGL|nr:unnamed protein product [Polarella glacialis]
MPSGESRQLESKDLPLAGPFHKAPRYRSQLPPAQDRWARGNGSRSFRPVPKKETIAKAAPSAPHLDVRAPVMNKTAPLPPPEHLINAKILEKSLSYQKLLKKAKAAKTANDPRAARASFVSAENKFILQPDQLTALRALQADAKILIEEQENEDKQKQLMPLDLLYQERIEAHGDWLRTHMSLEGLCNRSFKPVLDKLTGLDCEVNYRSLEVSYRYRNLEINQETVQLVKQPSLPQRIAALHSFDCVVEHVHNVA